MRKLDQEIIERCPSCGLELYEKPMTSFYPWATPLVVFTLSVMLFLLDLVNPASDGSSPQIVWAHWAVLGIWIFYITVQLLRFNPDYGWLLIPFGGFLFNIYFIFLDLSEGDNVGLLSLDWALNVVIPITTFVIFLPIIARIARKQTSHLEVLKRLVNQKEREFNASDK